MISALGAVHACPEYVPRGTSNWNENHRLALSSSRSIPEEYYPQVFRGLFESNPVVELGSQKIEYDITYRALFTENEESITFYFWCPIETPGILESLILLESYGQGNIDQAFHDLCATKKPIFIEWLRGATTTKRFLEKELDLAAHFKILKDRCSKSESRLHYNALCQSCLRYDGCPAVQEEKSKSTLSGFESLDGLTPGQKGLKLLMAWQMQKAEEKRIKNQLDDLSKQIRGEAKDGMLETTRGMIELKHREFVSYPFSQVFGYLSANDLWDDAFGKIDVDALEKVLDNFPKNIQEDIAAWRQTKEGPLSVTETMHGKNKTSLFG